ncbi:MAG: hypothetical protein CVV47_10560 [Spirochaetae bacterium HGW-Spirochaetae-3]|jgi:hypothetical protein|nr:MAG: hypothetical protein CVV47_10560 [Spirochaetae bacterium HGW-Spirochaetae-3]
MLRLTITSHAPRFGSECAVEAAAIIGFHSLSLEFPVLSFRDGAEADASDGSTVVGISIDESLDSGFTIAETGSSIALRLRDEDGTRDALAALYSCLDRRSGEHKRRDGETSARETPPGIMDSGYPRYPAKRGLESLFEREFILKDTDFDFLPDVIDATIALPEACDESELSAACDIAARLGIESLGLELPILDGKGRSCGTVIAIGGSDRCGLSLDKRQDRRIVRVSGRGPDLANMASTLCRRFPEAGDRSSWPELRDDIAKAVAMESLDGQLAWLGAMSSEIGDEAIVHGEPDIATREEAITEAFPSTTFKNRHDLVVLKDESYEFPWELDICRGLLAREVYPRIAPGTGTGIDVVVGEDREARSELEREIRREAEARGAVAPEVRVVCAFKQGFSWIRDYALPAIASIGGVASVDIRFAAFLPDGREAWTDEDGATPKIGAQRKDDPEAWLDPPVRLLQELYPIDDVIASELGIPAASVRFSLYEKAAGPRYALTARNADGTPVYEAEYEASFSERPYLDDFPGIGKAHPGTGRVAVRGPGTEPWQGSFSTDMESVWAAYQSSVLPACRRFIEDACGGEADAGAQPFFARLRLDIDASEPDETLPIRQDRISSLESLHEDIYFAGLDYFQTLGLTSCGKGIDAPGLILPVIRKRSGPPRMRFRLLGELSAEPAIESGGRRLTAPVAEGDVGVWIDTLEYDGDSSAFTPRFAVEATGTEGSGIEAFIRSYARLLSSRALAISEKSAGLPTIRFRVGESLIEATPPAAPPEREPIDIRSIDLLEDTLIGCGEYARIIDEIAGVPGLRVRQVAESRLGRAIHAIEILPSLPGYVSRTKLIAARPVYYVNARHHANEVSGTNAAFALIRALLVDPAYAGIADRVNIVVVPFENPDGAAIHQELAGDNPEWILHIARYNSLGKEIAQDYWNDSTIHGEAKAFTRVWRDWLPDVVTDNHGVPSHEWCQQFSGYTSPWFKGFWMPRALLYGYFWYVTDSLYADNRVLAEGVQEAVADLVGADRECGALNAEWRERFEKYAHAWMPRLFPAEYHKGMIFYWVPYAYKPDYYYAAVRFPWITASSFVTEVSDETATGAYLGLCARTHVLNDLAVIKLLADADPRIGSSMAVGRAGLSARKTRTRPPATLEGK